MLIADDDDDVEKLKHYKFDFIKDQQIYGFILLW